MKQLCDVCGEGRVWQEVFDTPTEWLGRKGTVLLVMYKCDHCKSEYADAAQSVLNKQAMIDFRQQIESENQHGSQEASGS